MRNKSNINGRFSTPFLEWLLNLPRGLGYRKHGLQKKFKGWMSKWPVLSLFEPFLSDNSLSWSFFLKKSLTFSDEVC